MTQAPAAGERSALRGYRWQYDHIAALVYDALLDGDLEFLRLTDPEAGRVDDLLLVRRGRVHGYQFKSALYGRALTFNEFVGKQRTHSGNEAPSLLRSLSVGWLELRGQRDDSHVHFVTNRHASVNDRLGSGADRPSPDHFQAFLTQVLEPLRLNNVALDNVDTGWRPAISKLREESGLAGEEFEGFLQSLHIDVAAGPGVPASRSTRRTDIITLSKALQRRVSEATDVVELTARDVLALTGWEDRPHLYNRHEFPVDLDTYQPLTGAIEQLLKTLECHDDGYLALIGPPGSGKSTLLSRALSGSADRVVRYYAYVPHAAPARTRLTARGFLHDVVVMLSEHGATGHELPGNDIEALRRQFADNLDAASQKYQHTGCRTIIVVDGLDHVDRDYSGNDGLLEELPHPREIPDGVLFVVGSRTRDLLRADARQQLLERNAVVDLEHHRLSPAAVLEICSRSSVTKALQPELHQRILELSGGYPLALGYILNQLSESDGISAREVLAALPAYAGDIAIVYATVWDEVEDDNDIVEILAVCSRLRNGFPTAWLSEWTSFRTVRTFRRKLSYLFRCHQDRWRFFHDSFRQFAADRTAWGDAQRPDELEEKRIHKRIADLCAEAADGRIADEQLYHRFYGEQCDEVLALAQQTTFRDQFRRLRSPELIRQDITLALDVAAVRSDVLAMVRLLLALVEVTQRASAIGNVNLPILLYEAGLAKEAITWCGDDNLQVPLAHAYELAEKMGKVGDSEGRRIFEAIEHNGIVDREHSTAGEQDDAALAWTRAAALFRPLNGVIAAIRNQLEAGPESTPMDWHAWHRYVRMNAALIDTVAVRNGELALTDIDSALAEIDSALAEHVEQLTDDRSRREKVGGGKFDESDWNRYVAGLTDLRVRAQAILLERTSTTAAARPFLDRLLSTVRDVPLFDWTMLDAAELLVRHGILNDAAALLDRTQYGNALTVRTLGDDRHPDTIRCHFRYWRLRYLLASSEDQVPESIPPNSDTPAGNQIPRDAFAHKDAGTIELVARIDAAARKLGRMEAAVDSGPPVPPTEVWNAVVSMFYIFFPAGGRSGSRDFSIVQKKSQLFAIIIDVAYRYGLLERLSEALMHWFEDRPAQWPLKLRLDLASALRSTGATAPWYRQTLREWEDAASSESVEMRLEYMADLVFRYTQDGEKETARRIVRSLVPMAFGVGYRKDYQFDDWVSWLRKALGQRGGDQYIEDAAWLARVIAAAEPMTEGAPGSTAIHLAPAVVPADPVAAVRIFEYLVRHGTIDHLDGLATLVGALVTHAGSEDLAAVDLAADITAELVAPAGNRAYRELAEALIRAAETVGGREKRARLAKSIANRTDKFALSTLRKGWRQGLGLEAAEEEYERDGRSSDDDHGALVLSDGRRIARENVASRIKNVEDIVALRRDESGDSRFDWSSVIRRQELTNEEIQRLIGLFDGRFSMSVHIALAEAAERKGERETALGIANDILKAADGESWCRQFSEGRQDAAAVAVRLGGQEARVSVCRNLAHALGVIRWLAPMLLTELDKLIAILDPGLGAEEIWPEVCTYLKGIAETLELPDTEVLSDHGCYWWMSAPSKDRRAAVEGSSPETALAELAVGHLSHPAFLVRDASTAIVIRALGNEFEAVAEALGRFAQPGSSDDILERGGRCLAGARSRNGYVVPASLQPLEMILANHPSQIMRDLSANPPSLGRRPLSPLYGLDLPRPMESKSVFLEPYQLVYKLLSDRLGLNPDAVLAVATRYASEALATLPDPEAVRNALASSSNIQFTYPLVKFAAARSAFGRVLSDLKDAGLLEYAPPEFRRLLRTVDIDALVRKAEGRPKIVPDPPPAGHDQTVSRWSDEIENRLEEYIAAATQDDQVLIGARCRLQALNWGHLKEEFVCGTIIGTEPPTEDDFFAFRRGMFLKDLASVPIAESPKGREPLIVENPGYWFDQIRADLIAFRPELAAKLAWIADPGRPGCWFTADGELGVEIIWWVDGWYGRAGPVFDNTGAEGHAVVATLPALAEIEAVFGVTTRHFSLTRRGREDGIEMEPVTTARSSPLTIPSA